MIKKIINYDEFQKAQKKQTEVLKNVFDRENNNNNNRSVLMHFFLRGILPSFLICTCGMRRGIAGMSVSLYDRDLSHLLRLIIFGENRKKNHMGGVSEH